MDKLALPADLADWQAKFERIHLLAEWAWSALGPHAGVRR